MIVVQILGQLLFSLRIILITVPDFQLDDVLISKIINDYICTSLVTGLCFDIIVACVVDNWSDIKKKQLSETCKYRKPIPDIPKHNHKLIEKFLAAFIFA